MQASHIFVCLGSTVPYSSEQGVWRQQACARGGRRPVETASCISTRRQYTESMQRQNRQSQAPTDPQNCRNKPAPMPAPAIGCKSGLPNAVSDKHNLHQCCRHLYTLFPDSGATSHICAFCRPPRPAKHVLDKMAGAEGITVGRGTIRKWHAWKSDAPGCTCVPEIALQNWHQASVSARHLQQCPRTYIERQGLKPEHCQGTSSFGTNTRATRRPGSDKLCRRAGLHSGTGPQGIYQS